MAASSKKRRSFTSDRKAERNFRIPMTDKDQSKKVHTLHLATKLLGRVQARNSINTKTPYESKLSTPFRLIDSVP